MSSRPSSRRIRAVATHVVAGAATAAESKTILPTPSGKLSPLGQSIVAAGDVGYPSYPTKAYDGSQPVWSGGSGWEDFAPDSEATALGIAYSKLPGGEHLSWGVQLDGLDTHAIAADPAGHQRHLEFIADAVQTFQVVKIPKQDQLTAEGQAGFGEEVNRMLGAQLPIQKVTDTGCPDENHPPTTDKVICIGRTGKGWKEEYGIPIVNTVKGIQWPEMGACSWHTDGSAYPSVGAVTVMHMKKAPMKGQGGLTGFASGYTIYDRLSVEQKTIADCAMTQYVEDGNWKHIYDMKNNGLRRINEPGELEDSYDHCHKLVVQHPVTGRKAFWVAPANLVALEGMGLTESQDFVEECLAKGLDDPDAIYWHEYDDGDLVLNDDRCMMHTATPVGPDSGTRVLHLCSSLNRTEKNRGNWKTLQYAHDGDEVATENLVPVEEYDEASGHMRIRMVAADSDDVGELAEALAASGSVNGDAN
eukprot:COSAG02_NODE_13_length_57813_cov_14.298276_48_plen_474_part_00